MHEITANDVANDRPIKQFYGKWPFVRFLGVQEPASTLFSILNGLGHILGWRAYRSVIPQNYKMYNVWKCYMLILHIILCAILHLNSQNKLQSAFRFSKEQIREDYTWFLEDDLTPFCLDSAWTLLAESL
ncbi:Post-GPI attachment to proteins factor 3 [Exaiptasia diaphana]|nr:Post-GPI attachment to proteins factor 3 [Exaiptasia diaphana]